MNVCQEEERAGSSASFFQAEMRQLGSLRIRSGFKYLEPPRQGGLELGFGAERMAHVCLSWALPWEAPAASQEGC